MAQDNVDDFNTFRDILDDFDTFRDILDDFDEFLTILMNISWISWYFDILDI